MDMGLCIELGLSGPAISNDLKVPCNIVYILTSWSFEYLFPLLTADNEYLTQSHLEIICIICAK